MRFKIDWANVIVGSKFAVFALFYFVFEGNFPSTSPRRGLYLEGFLRYRIGGLIFGGAYFRNFTVFLAFKMSLGRKKVIQKWTCINSHLINFRHTRTIRTEFLFQTLY